MPTIPTQAEDLVLREKIARIIDPLAMRAASEWGSPPPSADRTAEQVVESLESQRQEALTKADAILSMISAVPSIEGGEGDSSSCADRSSPQMANPTQSPFVWRDISSAPRDGTPILVAIISNGAIFTVQWDEDAAGWIDGSTDHFDEPVTYLPSHWQPLPLPPAPSSEAPPLSLKEDEGLSVADSGGGRPQEAVKSDGPRGLGGGEL